LVFVGGGPGGYVAAIKAAQLGLRTTCVDDNGALGGTCLNRGCIPSKALLNASHLYHEAKYDFDKKYGIKTSGVEVDVAKMQKLKQKTVVGLTGGIAGLFKKYGVTHEVGRGSFVDPHTVAVADATSGEQLKTVRARNVVIATGSAPTELPFLKFDEQRVVSSTGALEFGAVPESLVVVGGGVIGLELGSVWSRLGADVTVVEFTDQVAFPSDREVAKEVHKLLKRQGIKFELKRKVVGADVHDGHVALRTEAAAGGSPKELRAERVLVSVGRRPFTDGLGLDTIGVRTDARGCVEIDDQWQTNVPHVFAIGDVVRGPMLAHKAEEEGIAVVEHIAKPGSGHVNLDAIPSVIYTSPEVAWVGKSEEQLKEAGVEYAVGKFPFMANSRARTNATTDGFVKLLADKRTDRLLGAHIVGVNAGELIQELVLALEYGASTEDVARTSHAHPTLSEALKEAALAAHAKPIHF